MKSSNIGGAGGTWNCQKYALGDKFKYKLEVLRKKC